MKRSRYSPVIVHRYSFVPHHNNEVLLERTMAEEYQADREHLCTITGRYRYILLTWKAAARFKERV